jgi:hypothetical protein
MPALCFGDFALPRMRTVCRSSSRLDPGLRFSDTGKAVRL